MSHPRVRVAIRVAVIVVLAAAAGLGGYAETVAARPSAPAPKPRAVPAPPLVYRQAAAAPSAVATPTPGPAPTPAALARALRPLLRATALGPGVRAEVLDAATGAAVFRQDAASGGAPASTAKLLTAAAVLSVRPAGYRISTTVRRGTGGTLVLVGAGDPTLTGARPGRAGAYADAARISGLAAQLRAAAVRPTRIVVDDSLFSGPTVSPAWASEDVPSDYGAPITAVLADGGRAAPGAEVRSGTPDLAAGRELAELLGRPGLPVVRGRAPAGAAVLATVRSAPLSTLVAETLQVSDNVLAECLARQVALATHRPASFAGAAAAVRAVLTGLGVDPGAGLVDGSGLAAKDRVSAATLARLLALADQGGSPGLRTMLAGLPVAAWSGTLADRFLAGASRPGAGLVRAKTGSLTGVTTLAGVVPDRDGRLLAFAVLADRSGPTAPAEAALDAVAARLAGCGCR